LIVVGSKGLSQIAEPITWVTASVQYAVNDTFTVSLEARNLTDARYRANLGRPDILAGFETWGRTAIVSVAAKF
jgi:outer membrane receptor protein involved in Fe transport